MPDSLLAPDVTLIAPKDGQIDFRSGQTIRVEGSVDIASLIAKPGVQAFVQGQDVIVSRLADGSRIVVINGAAAEARPDDASTKDPTISHIDGSASAGVAKPLVPVGDHDQAAVEMPQGADSAVGLLTSASIPVGGDIGKGDQLLQTLAADRDGPVVSTATSSSSGSSSSAGSSAASSRSPSSSDTTVQATVPTVPQTDPLSPVEVPPVEAPPVIPPAQAEPPVATVPQAPTSSSPTSQPVVPIVAEDPESSDPSAPAIDPNTPIDLAGSPGSDSFTGAGGNDTLDGADGDDVLAGGDGDNAIIGGTGNDTISSGEGNSSIDAGDGDDLVDLTDNTAGHDTVLGGDGNDTVLLGDGGSMVDAGAGNDSVVGGLGPDNVHGADGNDVITGGGGNDSLYGDLGDDTLITGPGNSLADGGAGDDVVDGRNNPTGQDTLLGGAGQDTIYAGDGGDLLNGGLGDDVIYGGAGADSIIGTDGSDTIHAGGGPDTIDYSGDSTGHNLIDAGPGDDVVLGGQLGDTIQLGDGNNSAIGGAGADSITTGIGNSNIDAGGGNDTIDATANTTGRDTIHGGAGDDLVKLGDGGSGAYGDAGNDTLLGGAGADRLDGGAGDDSLASGGGADWVFGGIGNNTLAGGAGADTITLVLGDAGTNLVTDLDEASGDRLNLGDATGASVNTLSNVTTVLQTAVVVGSDTVLDLNGAAAGGTTTLLGTAADFGTFGYTNEGVHGIGPSIMEPVASGPVKVGTLTRSDNLTIGDEQLLSVIGLSYGVNYTGASLVGTGITFTWDPTTQQMLARWTDASTTSVDIYLDIPSSPTTAPPSTFSIVLSQTANSHGGAMGTDGSFSISLMDKDAIWGTPAADTLTGTATADNIYALAGNDLVDGAGGDDVIDTGAGDDTVLGGAGNDRVIVTAADGNDDLDGGSGIDTLDASLVSADLVVNLGAGTASGAGTDTLTGFEVVLTGAGNDQLIGSSGSDTLNAGSGANTLDGGAGGDSLISGGGDDVIVARDGDGDDLISAGAGTNTFDGSLVTGAIAANLTSHLASGAAGNDTLGGINKVIGGSGNDTLTGDAAAASTLLGGGGADLIITTHAGDSIGGGAGDDTIVVASALLGLVTLDGGTGTHDVLSTDAAVVNLGTLTGVTNIEDLTGTSSTGQQLTGNSAANVITGAGGDDTIAGGGGADTINAGGGNDIIVVAAADLATTQIDGAGGIDTLRTDAASASLAASNISGVENLTGTSPAGQQLTGSSSANVITGAGGDDTISGGGGADTIDAGGGNDVIVVAAADLAATQIAGGAGTDTLRTDAASASLAASNILGVENLTGTSGTGQALAGNAAANLITGAGGADTLAGGGGADSLAGGAGNDFYDLRGSGSSATILENSSQGIDTAKVDSSHTLEANVEILDASGASGSLVLTGNAADNSIIGGAGADTLAGGGGTDSLTGGAGADKFVTGAGVVVTDMSRAQGDILALGTGPLDLAAIKAAVLGQTSSGVDRIINGATIQNIGSNLTGADFGVANYTWSWDKVSYTEGGDMVANLTITRDGNVSAAGTGSLALSGTMVAGTDYVAPAGTWSIPAGSTSITIPITLINDSVSNGARTLTADLSNLSDGITTQAPITASYLDDDNGVGFDQLIYTVTEGGMVMGTIPLRGGPLATDVTITIGTASNGAGVGHATGADYTPVPSQTLVIRAGETSVSFQIPRTAVDSIFEGTEDLKLKIITVIRDDGVAIGGAGTSSIVQIQDGTQAPLLAWSQSNPTYSLEGNVVKNFTWTRTGSSVLPTQFRVVSVGNSSMFDPVDILVTTTAGQASGTIPVTLHANPAATGDATIKLMIIDPVDGRVLVAAWSFDVYDAQSVGVTIDSSTASGATVVGTALRDQLSIGNGSSLGPVDHGTIHMDAGADSAVIRSATGSVTDSLVDGWGARKDVTIQGQSVATATVDTTLNTGSLGDDRVTVVSATTIGLGETNAGSTLRVTTGGGNDSTAVVANAAGGTTTANRVFDSRSDTGDDDDSVSASIVGTNVAQTLGGIALSAGNDALNFGITASGSYAALFGGNPEGGTRGVAAGAGNDAISVTLGGNTVILGGSTRYFVDSTPVDGDHHAPLAQDYVIADSANRRVVLDGGTGNDSEAVLVTATGLGISGQARFGGDGLTSNASGVLMKGGDGDDTQNAIITTDGGIEMKEGGLVVQTGDGKDNVAVGLTGGSTVFKGAYYSGYSTENHVTQWDQAAIQPVIDALGTTGDKTVSLSITGVGTLNTQSDYGGGGGVAALYTAAEIALSGGNDSVSSFINSTANYYISYDNSYWDLGAGNNLATLSWVGGNSATSGTAMGVLWVSGNSATGLGINGSLEAQDGRLIVAGAGNDIVSVNLDAQAGTASNDTNHAIYLGTRDNTNERIDVGDGDNQVTIGSKGLLQLGYGSGQTSIFSGAGKDQIVINADGSIVGASNTNRAVISTGGDNDKVILNLDASSMTVTAGQERTGRYLSINVGEGDNLVQVAAGGGGSSSDGQYAGMADLLVDVDITAGSGNDTIIAGGQIRGASGASAVNMGNGDNLFEAQGGGGLGAPALQNVNVGAGTGADTIRVIDSGVNSSTLSVGDGDNLVDIDTHAAIGDMGAIYAVSNSNLTFGSGNDTMIAGGGMSKGTGALTINLGHGANFLTSTAYTTSHFAMSYGTVNGGNDKDTLVFKGNVEHSTVSTGNGDDEVLLTADGTTAGGVEAGSNVANNWNTGIGNDVVEYRDQIDATSDTVQMGLGADTIRFGSYTLTGTDAAGHTAAHFVLDGTNTNSYQGGSEAGVIDTIALSEGGAVNFNTAAAAHFSQWEAIDATNGATNTISVSFSFLNQADAAGTSKAFVLSGDVGDHYDVGAPTSGTWTVVDGVGSDYGYGGLSYVVQNVAGGVTMTTYLDADVTYTFANGGSTIYLGSMAADALVGAAGVDKFFGGAGDDTLTGGGGGDIFSLATTGGGNDVITDFSRAQVDRLNLDGNTSTAATQSAAIGYVAGQTVSGADRILHLDDGSTVTVVGIGSNIVATDFGGAMIQTMHDTAATAVSVDQVLAAGQALADGSGAGAATTRDFAISLDRLSAEDASLWQARIDRFNEAGIVSIAAVAETDLKSSDTLVHVGDGVSKALFGDDAQANGTLAITIDQHTALSESTIDKLAAGDAQTAADLHNLAGDISLDADWTALTTEQKAYVIDHELMKMIGVDNDLSHAAPDQAGLDSSSLTVTSYNTDHVGSLDQGQGAVDVAAQLARFGDLLTDDEKASALQHVSDLTQEHNDHVEGSAAVDPLLNVSADTHAAMAVDAAHPEARITDQAATQDDPPPAAAIVDADDQPEQDAGLALEASSALSQSHQVSREDSHHGNVAPMPTDFATAVPSSERTTATVEFSFSDSASHFSRAIDAFLDDQERITATMVGVPAGVTSIPAASAPLVPDLHPAVQDIMPAHEEQVHHPV